MSQVIVKNHRSLNHRSLSAQPQYGPFEMDRVLVTMAAVMRLRPPSCGLRL
jgi:hypothetical protein